MPLSIPTDIAKEFARELIRERLRSGLTQDQLASQANVSQAWISKFLSGKREDIRIETYLKLVFDLGGDVVKLLNALGMKDEAVIWRELDDDPDFRKALARVFSNAEWRERLKAFVHELDPAAKRGERKGDLPL